MKAQHVEGGGAPWYAPAESFEPCPWSCPTSGSCGPWMLTRPAPRKASVSHTGRGAVCEGSLRHAVSLALSVSEWYRKDGQHTVRVGLLDRPVVGKGGRLGSVSSNPSAQSKKGQSYVPSRSRPPMWYFSSISSASQAYTTPEEPAEKRVRVSLHQAMQICAV